MKSLFLFSLFILSVHFSKGNVKIINTDSTGTNQIGVKSGTASLSSRISAPDRALDIKLTTEPEPTTSIFSTYYVSPTGSDNNPGTRSAPFLTPAKAIGVAVKKDTILLQRGGRFLTAPYIAPGKDSLFIGAYDTGAAPIWDGSVTIDPASLRDDGGGWRSVQNSSFPLTLNVVTMDGKPQKMARFPASGYRQFHAHNGQGQGYLIDTTLSELGRDFTGWQLVIRLINWSIGRVRVTKQSGDTLFYTQLAGQKYLGYQPINGWGYFLQNSTTAPASFGDFAYDSATKRVSVFYGTEAPASHTLRIAVHDRGVNVDADGITFSSLHFTGQNKWAIVKGSNGENTRVLDCEIDNNGESAFYFVDKSDIVFTGNKVHDVLSDGIKALRSDATKGCHRWEVGNNIFKNIGPFEGMGYGGDPLFVPVIIEGDYSHIYNNQIDSAGYNGIHTSGRGLLIEANLVEHTGFHLADGAGIYNYWGPKHPGTPAKSTIRNNTVLHSIGSAEGTYGTRYPVAPYDVTNDNGKFAGIYLDENSRNFDLYGNNIGYTSWAAFMLNGTHDINIFSNTAFKFWRAYAATDYSGIVIPANNIRISSNIFSTDNYSNAFKVAPQNLFGLACNFAGRTASGWLAADSNKYFTFALPTSNLFAEQTLSGHNLKTFTQWKSYLGSDAASTVTQKTSHSYYTNPTGASINAAVTGIWEDADGNPVTGSVQVPAYGSVILFNSAKSPNTAPTAIAGTDVSLTYPIVTATLSGNGSDIDGSISGYSWTIVSGTGGSLSSPMTASTEFTGTPGASYLLRLTVTDNSGATATDDVAVAVAKAAQEIEFGAIEGKVYGDAPFSLSATATSGLAVSYTSSNASVATISGGMVTIIAAGVTTITAVQAGDENYSAAPTAIQTFNVEKASQSISFPSLAGVTFGDAPLSLEAVASSSLPVSYTVVSGPATISGNTAVIAGAGDVVIEATQEGSADFNAATPVRQQFTVAQATQVINFRPIPDLTYGRSAYSLEATSTSGLPIGYRIISGPATISGDQLLITGTGRVIVEAFQDGNTDYIAAAVQQRFTVLKAIQQISFGPLGDKTYSDAPFSVNATVSSGLAASYRVVSGPAVISGNLVDLTGAGEVTLEAFQAGDNNYLEAQPVQQSFVVQKAAQNLTFASVPSKSFGDAPFAVSATASSGLPTTYRIVSGPATISNNIVSITGAGTIVIEATQPGDDDYLAAAVQQSIAVAKAAQTITFPAIATKTYGDAAFAVSATSSSRLPVNYNVLSGPAIVSGNTVTITGAGTVTLQATQSGNENYNAATAVSQSFVVQKATQTVNFPVISGKTYGDPAFSISATASSGLAVGFSIVSGPATVSGNVVTITGAGTVTLQAIQTGNANYNAASAPQSFTVSKKAQEITFPIIPNKTYGNTPFAISATASSGLAVSFRVASGPATVSGNTVTITGAGTVTIEALQAGNSNFSVAPLVARSFVVAKASQTISFPAIANKTYGSAPFALTATTTSGLAVTYSVTGPATVTGSTLTITGAGTVIVEATQLGNVNYNAATPVKQTFTVAKASQTITFPVIPNKVYGTAPFTLNATASSSLLVNYTVVSGPATVNNSVVTITGTGKVTIRATQAGNNNFNAATAVQQNFTVTKGSTSTTATTVTGNERLLEAQLITNETALSVYPNPMAKQGTLRIQAGEPLAGFLNIYNGAGQVVKSLGYKRIEKGFPQFISLDVSTLAKGTYFLRFASTKTTAVHAFTVL
jgi:hypothetical protein